MELARPDDLNRAYANLSELLMEAGQLEEAVALVVDAVGSGRLVGIAPTCALIGADALVRLGRWGRAEDLLSGLGSLVGICGNSRELARAPIVTRRGDFEEAARLLATADELTAGLSDVQIRGRLHVLQAELALEQGRSVNAWDQVERALSLVAGTEDEEHTPEMCAVGVHALADQVDRARGGSGRSDGDKARLLALGLVREAERSVAAPSERGGRCAPRAEAFASMCAAEQSRLRQSDAELWREASRRWEAAGEPYPAAYCRWREAEALLEGRAGRAQASDCLQLAWQVSATMGALPLKEKIERLAQRAHIELVDAGAAEAGDGSTVAGDLGLTNRELEVLGQLAAGRTDREIAELLFISKKTASVHVSNLLRKLDVANRVEAGKVGQAHGLG